MCCGGVQSIEKTAIACNVKNLDELVDALNEVIPKPEPVQSTAPAPEKSSTVEDTAGKKLKKHRHHLRLLKLQGLKN